MTARYKVLRSNGSSLLPVSGRSGSKPRDIIVASRDGLLPCGLDDENLVILHEIHANNSMRMKFSEEDGAFTCWHCHQTVNISKDILNSILDALSKEYFGSIGTTAPEGMTVFVAHLVKTIPECSNIFPESGIYIQEIKE